MMDRFFWLNGIPTAFNPLQIAEGAAENLQELTEAEKQALLNPPIDIEKVREEVKAQARALRNPILTEVVQIALVARDQGNDALANEVLTPETGVRDRLRDITDDPALNAAATREEMEQAVVLYWRALVGAVSPELRNAFKALET